MAFTLNETYFSGKFAIWRYLTSKSSKIAQVEVFGHFLDFAPLVFLDFGHNDWCAWCLVVFLQFTGPVNVFLLFFNMANLLQIKLWEFLEKIGRKNVIKKHPWKIKHLWNCRPDLGATLPIFNQCLTSISTENIRKPGVFSGYRSGKLVENGLIYSEED